MDIKLPSIYPIADPRLYKLHLACFSGKDQPLDIFVRSREEWNCWNAWRENRDDFSREYIFALIDFYPQSNRWLFGGVYKVLSRRPINKALSYEIQLLTESEPYVGRLKLMLKRPGRAKAFNLENHYNDIVVSEVLAEPYTGESFRGYDTIDLTFPMLENLMQRQRIDWKTALENAKGVYLITDCGNGKRYIGSAYGSEGIWSRWQCYVSTGHGYNDELTALIVRSGLKYARDHFRFTLLEYLPPKTTDDVVIRREGYWKTVLLCRQPEFGYNKN